MIYFQKVSLCAIVRNEKENQAGGIVSFLDYIMPYVAGGVIVDTGSTDGTRELLEEAKQRYPHLAVYDHEFKGFAEARNVALDKVKTLTEETGIEYALVLDADERIRIQDLRRLRRIMHQERAVKYNFQIQHIHGLHVGLPLNYKILNPRLFMVKGMNVTFIDNLGKDEKVYYPDASRKSPYSSTDTMIAIQHYDLNIDEIYAKTQWYSRIASWVVFDSPIPHWKS